MSYREDFEKETGKKEVDLYISDDANDSTNYWSSYAMYLENHLKDAEEKIQQLIVYAKTL